MSSVWSSLKGCGRLRDTQSIRFLRTPGIEALYSGETMTRAFAPRSRSVKRAAAAGGPSAVSESPSYAGTSKS